MKKFLLLLTLFCAFFSTARATEVEIGADDPNQSNISLLPINALWKYGWSQQIFTSDEIGMAGTINSITLQLYHSGANPPSYSVNIYMAEVSEDVFATTSSWVSLGASDLVFSGTTFANLPTTATDMAEFTIDLDNPFVYSGSGNLLIAFANNTGSYVSGLYAKAFGVTSDPKRALYKYQDSGAIDPTNPNVDGTLYALRNVITLDITGSGSGPTCDKPETCDVTDITENSATVNFAGGSGTYNVEYKGANDADWTSAIKNTTLTSIPLTDLMPNTSYQVRVQSVCGDNTSGYKSASFQTLIGLPFAEHFASSSIPSGWNRYTGTLNADGSAALTASTSYWSFGTYNGVFDNHAHIEVYSTRNAWLVTPSIPIPAMEDGDPGYHMLFNLALTYWTGNNVPAPAAQAGAHLYVLASMDGGNNWATLREWNNTGSSYVFDNITCSAEGEEVDLDLTAYAGQTIQLAFYLSNSGSGDNRIHIDNLLVEKMPNCLKPTDLHDVQGAATTNSIQVAWTANSGEIAWHVQYKPSDDSEAEWITSDVSTNPYTINGLQPFTNYDVRVAAVCSETDVTDYCKPIKAKTATGVPYEEKFDTTALPGEWKRYEVLKEQLDESAPMVSTVDGWDVGAANGVFPAANNHLLLNIAGADCNYWIVSPTIVMAAGYQLTFDLALTQAAGSAPVAVAPGEQNDDQFIVFISSDGGENWTELRKWGVGGYSYDDINPEGQLVTFDLSSYVNQSILIALYGESTVANGNNNLHIANFKIAEIPACQQANSLVITDLEATSATAVWTSDDVEANWQYGLVADPAADFAPADGDFANNTSAFVAELTGLSEKTNYAFFLRRACEGSNSEPLVKNFRTPAMPLALPWSENFDTLTSGIPEGWDNSEGTTTDASYRWNKYTDSDNTCLRFNSYNNSTDKTNILATPRIYLSEDAILSFRWKNPKGGAGEVLISNDNGATRTALVSNLTGISDWKTYEIDLSAYSGSKVIIYFAATSNCGYGDAYLYLDDVAVAAAPDCLKPSGLAISGITATSATLVWNSETDGLPWVYAYAPASEPEPADDAFTDISINSIELEGLEDCTSYKFYLRKNCGTEAKSESVAISFQTKQVPVDAGDSYSEDFEGEAKWLLNNGDLANAWVIGTAAHNGEGSHALYISNDGGATHAYTNNAPCVVFAQKAFNFAAGNYVFSYDWLCNGEGSSTLYDYLRVALVPADVELVPGTALPTGVSATALPAGCIALDGGMAMNLSTSWATFTSSEIAVPAGTYNIVIMWRDDTSGGTNPPAAIDNFSFAKIACAMPDDFHAVDSLATTTSVVLKWTQMSDEDDFVIRYKVYGAEAFADSVFVLNDDSTTLTGLVPGTAYELQVAAWCDPADATAIGKYSASIYALTKCAAVASINQDFESAVLCWSYIQETNSYGSYPDVYILNNGKALSGTNALYFLSQNGSSAVDQYAILPELINLDNMRIKFSVRKEDASDEATYAIVGVMTDPADPTTFVALDSIAVDAIEYAEHIVEFGAYTGAGKYVAIKMPASTVDYASLLIDDVVVEEIPQCLDPQGLHAIADEITSSSALLAWTPQGAESDWLVRYRISGAADWVDTIQVNNDTLLLENLAGATIYEAQVAAWCDPADDEALSPFSSSISFTTACGIISTFPYAENFESFAASTAPTCWDNSASTSETLSSNPERIWGVYEYGGNKMIRMYNYYVKSGQAVINTPAIALPAEAYELSFDYAHTASCGAMVVRISTDDGANWTALEPSYAKTSSGTSYDDPGTFQEAVVNLAAYAGQTILIQFYSVANYGSGAIFVDNIDIHKAPSCIKPQGLEAILTKGDGSVATLSWSAGASEEAWVVEYSRNADMSEAISLPASDTALAISGLLSDSIYYARVKAVCDATDQSDWSAQISFIPTNAIIINDSTASSSYVPFYGYYADYSANSQFIVPAAEIEALMWDSITKLTFYSTSSYPNASWGSAQWEVYIAPTNASSLSALNDWSKMSLAKSAGTLSVVNSQMVITLDHPFVYEGGNLVIGFKQVTAGSGSSCTWYGKTGASGSSYYSYTSYYSTSSNTSTFRPKVRFDYIEGAEPSCYKVKDFVVSGITASSATIGWTNGSEDQDAWQIVYSCDPNFDIAEATPVDIASNPYPLAGLLTDTLYNVYVRANCGEGGYSAWNSISFRTAKSCQTPDDLVAAPGLNTAEISWNTYGQTGFNLRYIQGIDTVVVPNVASPYELTGLQTATAYKVQVQAACESEDSWSAAINFKTAYGTPFEEKFATTSLPDDWARYSGLLEDVLDGGALTTTTSGWNFNTGNGVFNNHAKVNIFGTSCKYWLATPAVHVSGNVQLTFDLALTKFSGTLDPVDADAQADDKFAVLISTDNGDNWSVLRLWDNAGSEYVYNNIACSATGEQIAIDLSAYNGQAIKIAFYGESTVSGNGDNNLHIDNVLIDKVPTCLKPTGFSISDVKAHSAQLSWTAGDEGQSAWQIALDTIAGFNPDTLSNLINVTENPYVLTGLAPETRYYAYVRANCGTTDGVSRWTDVQTFKTTIACPAPTGLAAVLTPGNGSIATLNWNAGEAQAWQIEYSLNSDLSDSIEVLANDTFVNLTGLTAEQTYYARVKADCGELDGKSLYSAIISFKPTDAYELLLNDGTATNEYVPIYGYWTDNYTRSQFIIPAEQLESLEWDSLTVLTFYSSSTNTNWDATAFEVYVAEVPETTMTALTDWNAMTKVMNEASLNIIDNQMVITFDEAYQYQGGNLLIGIKQTASTASTNAKHTYWYGVSANGASFGGYGDGNNVAQRNFLPKMLINYVPGVAPACPNPKNLAVSGITDSEATFSWKAVEDATWEYALVQGAAEPASFISTEENSVTIADLTEATEYTFYLRRACGADGYSDATLSVAFTTEIRVEAVPFGEDFEGNGSWKFVNGSEPNAWVIGNAANNGGEKALYISNDGGANNTYTKDDAVSASFATILLNFAQAGEYTFAYDWKAYGDYNVEEGELYDYLRVVLVPASATLEAGNPALPEGYIALDNGGLYGATDWQHYSSDAEIEAGQYKLVFAWFNDESDGEDTPAAIDNISIQEKGPETGLEGNAGIFNNGEAFKFLRDNKVFILVNGVIYDATGRKVEVVK